MKISISTSTSKISEHARTMCRSSDSNGISHYYWVQKCSVTDSPANDTYSGGRCLVRHCNRRQGASVDSSGRVYQGPYCPEHACKLGPHKCCKPKNRDERYCKEHATCSITHCSVPAYGLSGKTLPWYCPDHTCTISGCSAVRFSGRHCSRHFYPDAVLVPAPPRGDLRRCREDGCYDICAGWASLCAWHKCKEDDCNDRRRVGGLYCQRHFGRIMMDHDPLYGGHY